MIRKIGRIVFAVVLTAAAACSDSEDSLMTFDGSYFPLHIGDSWVYRPANEEFPEMNDVIPSVTRTVTRTVEIDGNEYYEVELHYDYSKTNPPRNSFTDSAYFRVEPSGFVYQYDTDAEAVHNIYRLAAEDGEEWQMMMYNNWPGFVSLKVTDVRLNDNVVLNDCKAFSFDVVQMADEEHYATLARGLGIVEEGNAWGFDMKLKKAVIDGRVYEF